MKRIGFIGDNSIEYISNIIDCWNLNYSVVLIDYKIPYQSKINILRECNIEKCFIDEELLDEFKNNEKIDIVCIKKSNRRELSKDIYNKFQIRKDNIEALVLYSSGTTGISKGCRLSHFSIYTNALAISNYMKLTSEDFVCIVKSLTHSSTFVGELLVCLINKVRLLIGSTLYTSNQIINFINSYKITTMCVNPTLLSMYSDVVLKKNISINSLKNIYVSGSILINSIYNKAILAFCHANIKNVYGLTECGPRVTANVEVNTENILSVGKPIQGVTLKILNYKGEIVKEGDIGIIYVKTLSIFMGYVVQTAESHWDGEWYKTNDLGYLDKDKNLFIVGRFDNMILHSSHNIFPETIEQLICDNCDIKDCIVLGEKESLVGERIILLYIAEEDKTDILKKICKQRLANYEIPYRYIKVENILYNENGKKIRNINNYKINI